LNIGYSWFDFYILNRALKLSNKSYNNSNLSKFYRFLKSFLTINIKMICGGFIVGVGAYIVTSTSGRDLSTGGMLAGYIIAVRMLILADNIVIIWPNIRNTYKAYSNLSNLARGSIS
jgi:ABC-type protease/lipase transport system fused ATPase/permease subunit